uniref:Macaca fascicularis brain cDNA clone: QbsB-10886, similar to human similar to protein kinase/ribonuclease IRE1 beta(LOC388226), mRNA, RefSeq: XM_370946.2 n=1 Tax=Macaca fascicularis TaxID=9541 RepID=I7GB69_MACFA|nr:unnamed protein product [Macaca fascicularis]
MFLKVLLVIWQGQSGQEWGGLDHSKGSRRPNPKGENFLSCGGQHLELSTYMAGSEMGRRLEKFILMFACQTKPFYQQSSETLT